ncbi:MAG: hypothetical protein JNL67_16115 [Planctomycetaceae bacterium]|nr:hypothetical protein [Planctomycetaceae bacterium]
MNFSLRSLIAIVLLIAFALMTLNGYLAAGRIARQIHPLRYQIGMLERELGENDSKRRQILLHALEERESFHAIYEEVLAQYPTIRDRNHQMVPRPVDIFSIKRMPAPGMLPSNFIIEYKLVVPVERPVWVRFGVHTVIPETPNSTFFDQHMDWRQSPSLTNSKLFEQQILPGEHLLTIREDDHPGRREISIALDGKLIFETQYSDAASNPIRNYNSGISQSDFPRQKPLPHLLTSPISTNTPNFSTTKEAYTIWLSDDSDQLKSSGGNRHE